MKYMNIYDTHTHSIHSFDGNHSVEKMCESAILIGAKGICISDHCDIGMKDYDLLSFAEKQYNDTLDYKNKYAGKIDLLLGIELGQAIYDKKISNHILEKYNYDFVLGSIHNLDNMEDFYFLDYKKYDVENLLKDYFLAILELAKWDVTDSIAHLTYPLRYIVAREHIDVDISKYYDIIDEIFDTIIKNNKALELNVSGLFMDMKDTLPNKSLIKRFHDMGGKYVTVGSDSHYYDKICNGIDLGLDILKECGFDYYTIFKNRNPVLIEIK